MIIDDHIFRLIARLDQTDTSVATLRQRIDAMSANLTALQTAVANLANNVGTAASAATAAANALTAALAAGSADDAALPSLTEQINAAAGTLSALATTLHNAIASPVA